MKKDSALYRFVYTVALLTAAAAVSGTGIFGLYSALADLALADNAAPSPLTVTAVYLALFVALAASALVFTAAFNWKQAAGLFHAEKSTEQTRAHWHRYTFAAAGAVGLFLVLRFGVPYIGFLDDSQLRLGLVFFFLPFICEYALGFGRQPSPGSAPVQAKPAESRL